MDGSIIFPLIPAAFFGGMLAWGLRTGRMPARNDFMDRTDNPVGFWIIGGMYAAFCLGGLIWAATTL